MMKRLIEQTDSRDPLLSRAAKIVDSAQPLAPSDAMRRRVLASVVRERLPFAASRRWMARPAAIGSVLLATTAAAASFHEGWLPQAYRIVADRVAARLPGASGGDLRASSSVRVVSPAEESRSTRSDADFESHLEASQWVGPVSAAAIANASAGQAGAVAEDELPRVASPGRRVRAAKSAKVVADGTWDDGAAIVLSAIEILRRQHDAARAGQLLDEYLRSHPQGALREDAMALAAEAASARGDQRESRRLAAQYEHAFPDGRFRQALQAAALPSGR
jgi:hypothetical protein